MGTSASSTSAVVTNKKIVTEQELESLTQQINKIAIDTIINNTSKADVNSNINQMSTMGDLNISGIRNAKVKYDSTQKSDLSFVIDVSQSDKINQTVISAAAQTVADKLYNNFTTSSSDTAKAKSQAESNTELLSVLAQSSNSDSAAITNTNIDIENRIKQKISRVISNDLSQNFTSENMKQCLSNLIAAQTRSTGDVNITDIANADISVMNEQTLTANFKSSCQQFSDTVQQINHDFAQNTGILSDFSTATISNTDMDTTSSAAATAKGSDASSKGSSISTAVLTLFLVIGVVLIMPGLVELSKNAAKTSGNATPGGQAGSLFEKMLGNK
jgi:hypothetical protein